MEPHLCGFPNGEGVSRVLRAVACQAKQNRKSKQARTARAAACCTCALRIIWSCGQIAPSPGKSLVGPGENRFLVPSCRRRWQRSGIKIVRFACRLPVFFPINQGRLALLRLLLPHTLCVQFVHACVHDLGFFGCKFHNSSCCFIPFFSKCFVQLDPLCVVLCPIEHDLPFCFSIGLTLYLRQESFSLGLQKIGQIPAPKGTKLRIALLSELGLRMEAIYSTLVVLACVPSCSYFTCVFWQYPTFFPSLRSCQCNS